MKIKGVITEDFVNYKKPCMTIMMPFCDFKCGAELCQNSELATAPAYNIDNNKLQSMYQNNPITEAICFQGLEPFDSDDVFDMISCFRSITKDDIIIYTGYTEQELKEKGFLQKLKKYGIINIIVKVGRYIPNNESHYDELLGVTLVSQNQYATRVC